MWLGIHFLSGATTAAEVKGIKVLRTLLGSHQNKEADLKPFFRKDPGRGVVCRAGTGMRHRNGGGTPHREDMCACREKRLLLFCSPVSGLLHLVLTLTWGLVPQFHPWQKNPTPFPTAQFFRTTSLLN